MGWKAACIVASRLKEPNLRAFPPHDPEFARRIAAALPIRQVKPVEVTSFEEGMHPDRLTIGAYAGSLIIGDHSLCNSCFNGDVPPVIHAINEVLPNATVLAMS